MAFRYVVLVFFFCTSLCILSLTIAQIGNKRLKVQHKQIRRNDMHDAPQDSYTDNNTSSNIAPPFQGPALPPKGPTTNNMWFDTAAPDPETQAENQDNTSALNNLESLQSALPDIPGKNTSANKTT